jgi:hypothetical protein
MRWGNIRPLVPVAVSMLVVTGCTFSAGGNLDIGGLEEEIASGIEDQTGTAVTVDCPDEVKIEAGNTFDCTATDESGTTGTVRVTQKDDEGNVEWELNPES